MSGSASSSRSGSTVVYLLRSSTRASACSSAASSSSATTSGVVDGRAPGSGDVIPTYRRRPQNDYIDRQRRQPSNDVVDDDVHRQRRLDSIDESDTTYVEDLRQRGQRRRRPVRRRGGGSDDDEEQRAGTRSVYAQTRRGEDLGGGCTRSIAVQAGGTLQGAKRTTISRGKIRSPDGVNTQQTQTDSTPRLSTRIDRRDAAPDRLLPEIDDVTAVVVTSSRRDVDSDGFSTRSSSSNYNNKIGDVTTMDQSDRDANLLLQRSRVTHQMLGTMTKDAAVLADVSTNRRPADDVIDRFDDESTTKENDQLVFGLRREVKLLRQENHYLRQQLSFPVKPKGRLQLDNDERFLSMIKSQISCGDRQLGQQALLELLQENIADNLRLRSENASLQDALDDCQRQLQAGQNATGQQPASVDEVKVQEGQPESNDDNSAETTLAPPPSDSRSTAPASSDHPQTNKRPPGGAKRRVAFKPTGRDCNCRQAANERQTQLGTAKQSSTGK